MSDTLIAIILSLISSFIYDALKTTLKRKPSCDDSHEYTLKYVRDIKMEFYISLPLGILFLFFSTRCPDSMQIGALTLSFFMFSISLMAFMCLTEVVNNLSNHNSNDDV